jgi:sugar-phosphatase
VNGVIAAKAARMKVVAVPDAHQLKNPAFSIADLILPSLVHLDDAQFKAITGHFF